MKIARYSAMTRPRIAGSTLTCTSELHVGRIVMAARPTGTSTSTSQLWAVRAAPGADVGDEGAGEEEPVVAFGQ